MPEIFKDILFIAILIAFVAGIIWVGLHWSYDCDSFPRHIDPAEFKRNISVEKNNPKRVLACSSSVSSDANKKTRAREIVEKHSQS